ncbi:MAG TPA: anthranilate phosphoribosyltransferase [Candidatus Binataceae bacterium]|nr:anthranilate phosphoribosyltransferase [Candidatus Binataceae bacterium]
MINLREAFEAVLKGRSLDTAEAESVMGEILDDVVPDALVAGFLVALKLKGESAAELSGGVRAMRKRARPLNLNGGNVLDTAGTGGDGAGTFNISTGAALIAAAAGVPVAKHGNRAVSGRVGAADVLERMGVRIELDPAGLERCLKRANICFVFAPAYHPVLARLAVLRRTLGIRTVFNLMAPMANPARPRRQLLGVAEPRLLRPMAEALAALGVEHAMVVHGNDGLDEISMGTATALVEVRDGELREFEMTPETFGLRAASPAEFLTADVKEATELLRRTLAGDPGAAHDVLALNGGAAIYVGGGAATLTGGVDQAHEILASGRALETLEKLRLASLESAAV